MDVDQINHAYRATYPDGISPTTVTLNSVSKLV